MARVQLAALLLLALSCAGAVGSLLVSHSYRFEPLASQRLQVSSERQHMLTWWWCRGLRHQGLICASRERLLYPPCRVGSTQRCSPCLGQHRVNVSATCPPSLTPANYCPRFDA